MKPTVGSHHRLESNRRLALSEAGAAVFPLLGVQTFFIFILFFISSLAVFSNAANAATAATNCSSIFDSQTRPTQTSTLSTGSLQAPPQEVLKAASSALSSERSSERSSASPPPSPMKSQQESIPTNQSDLNRNLPTGLSLEDTAVRRGIDQLIELQLLIEQSAFTSNTQRDMALEKYNREFKLLRETVPNFVSSFRARYFEIKALSLARQAEAERARAQKQEERRKIILRDRVADPRLVYEFKPPGGAALVAINSDGTRLALASLEMNHVYLFDLSSRSFLNTFEHKHPVKSLSFSDDDRYLATGTYQEARLFDLNTRTLVHEFKNHSGNVWSLDFSRTLDASLEPALGSALGSALGPSRRLLVTGDHERARVFDLSTLAPVLEVSHRGWVRKIAVRPSDNLLITSSSDGHARFFNLDDGAERLNFPHQGPKPDTLSSVLSFALSRDGSLLVTGSMNEARFFNPKGQSDPDIPNSPSSPSTPIAQHLLTGFKAEQWVQTVTLSPDEKLLAIGTDESGASLLDLSSTDKVYKLDLDSGGRLALNVKSLVFTRDGKHVITGSADGVVRVFQVYVTIESE